jgi:transketolase
MATNTGTDWARRIRELTLDLSHRAHVGHIGSSLCVAEILAVVYRDLLQAEGADDPNRDRFVLGKGHAALALFATLHLRGWLSEDDLNTFFTDGTYLGVHPDANVNGIDFSTGSLGMGLGFAVGAALAAKLEDSDRRVFALVSDAECNEGSLWESAHFAAHHKLGNLVAFVDDNSQQAFGYTHDVLDLGSLTVRFEAAGWAVVEVDGHDETAIRKAVDQHDHNRPLMVVAKTVFGKGVDYMEGQIKWHYLPMSDDQFADAMAQLAAEQGTAS